MSQTVGIVFSGSGYLDGTEIQEATLALYFLDKLGVSIQAYSINEDQYHIINHANEGIQTGQRNCLEESSRITRGNIKDIKQANTDELSALILPGGFGAAKNLSDFAFKGDQLTVNKDLAQLIKTCHSQEKPMGFICIAPVIAAALIPGVTVTIGSDTETAQAIQSLGANHVSRSVTEIAIDELNRIVSTPAYMYGNASISDVAKGIEALVTGVVDRVRTLTST